MRYNKLTRWTERRLRFWLFVFFLALLFPTLALIWQSYAQLKWEAFHHHRVIAEKLSDRIDQELTRRIDTEEARPFSDYAFLNVAGEPSANFIQRSPLSGFPLKVNLPGTIGYFQIDTDGRLSTPIVPATGYVPADYGISTSELTQRLAVQKQLINILSQNRLLRLTDNTSTLSPRRSVASESRQEIRSAISEAPATGVVRSPAPLPATSEEKATAKSLAEEPAYAQSAFDKLGKGELSVSGDNRTSGKGFGRVEDLKLESSFRQKAEAEKLQKKNPALADARSKRKERVVLPEQGIKPRSQLSEADSLRQDRIRVSIFESEIDPFEASLLDSGQLVLFRKVWRDGHRYIQGILLNKEVFLRKIVQSAFRDTQLAGMSDLVIAYGGDVLAAYSGVSPTNYLTSAQELEGALLYQTHLNAPFGDLQLIFSIKQLPAGPAGRLIFWTAAILLIVMGGGTLLMYGLGRSQIRLAKQQQDFVSAVSHELKTPLTSIRMYGEMLREGWADEDKKLTYYDFIYDESERLSRLISNVLQLARMTRNDLSVNLKRTSIAELIDGIRSKISSQVARAGFDLDIRCDKSIIQREICIDPDFFSQIMINLVDNALKFSAKGKIKKIDITCEDVAEKQLRIGVRDYGTGVAKDQMRKIFNLFYRSENELTRETVGTGIGLALVKQLVQIMHGNIDVANREPGAEFSVTFNLEINNHVEPTDTQT